MVAGRPGGSEPPPSRDSLAGQILKECKLDAAKIYGALNAIVCVKFLLSPSFSFSVPPRTYISETVTIRVTRKATYARMNQTINR